MCWARRRHCQYETKQQTSLLRLSDHVWKFLLRRGFGWFFLYLRSPEPMQISRIRISNRFGFCPESPSITQWKNPKRLLLETSQAEVIVYISSFVGWYFRNSRDDRTRATASAWPYTLDPHDEAIGWSTHEYWIRSRWTSSLFLGLSVCEHETGGNVLVWLSIVSRNEK